MKKKNGDGVQVLEPMRDPPRCLAVGARGIRTSSDFKNYMSTLMSDLVAGRVTPGVGNSACNAGGKLLKAVEMECRYGTKGPGSGPRVLLLADLEIEADTAQRSDG